MRAAGGPVKSEIEELFAFQVRVSNLPPAQREHAFARDIGRQWRFDFAWPDRQIAAEIEGGIWTGGRHSRGAGFSKDIVKYNAAAELGWFVFRFSGDDVNNGSALAQIERVLGKSAQPTERTR